ncbi:MAG: VWA domain-containing protein [Thermoanaerobaculales bacterium]|jgi:Ca-activated chloride channel family protein|nr:VWA domain-containing protein [Thermoanaerobaculales bacterium]
MVSFAEPRLLILLLLPGAAAAAVVFRHLVRLRLQRGMASPAVWDRVMGGVPATGLVRMLLWCTAAALIVLALARPQWGELPHEESVRTRDLVLALDVSDSMLAADMEPSRLARSIEAAQRLLPLLEGNRVGVVVFAGDAYPLVPLTKDLDAVSVFLGGIYPGMVGRPGSDLERAVAAALELLPPDGEGRVVVLVTDGENLQGNVDAAVKAIEESGVGALTVVAGTERGGPIPVPGPDGAVHHKRDANGQPVITRAHPEVLAAIASAVDGDSVRLDDSDVVHQLAAIVEQLRTREEEANRKVQKVEQFPLFLTTAAALLVLGFLLSPWRRLAATGLLLGLVSVPATAQHPSIQTGGTGGPQPATAPKPPAQTGAALPDGPAEGPPSEAIEPPLWQKMIPGGSRRMARDGMSRWREGELEDSARSFAGAAMLDPEDPERLYDLGTVLGAGGQLEAALPMLERAHAAGVPNAAYNSGTASLQQQQAEAAVQWLRQAVLADPGDLEAKRNYELALALLEQQQQQQEQEQEQENNDEQQEDEQQQEREQENQEEEQQQQEQEQPQPQPTPTPNDNEALFAALERAEAEAREAMQSPTPQPGTVEKDW